MNQQDLYLTFIDLKKKYKTYRDFVEIYREEVC